MEFSFFRSRDVPIGMATDYGLDGSSSVLGNGKRICLLEGVLTALGST
jgi:hypothetical protein